MTLQNVMIFNNSMTINKLTIINITLHGKYGKKLSH